MPRLVARPALFVDFDNTITLGDVLDRIIERYSASDAWRTWESEWQAGRMSTEECLRRQVGNLRASPQELRQFVYSTGIDPAFPRIVAWARRENVELCVVSDNFEVLVRAILNRHGLPDIKVRANELEFRNGLLEARFPFRDARCQRCAHCKAQHLRATKMRPRIYVGDGQSDICPARIADVVFAKDSLASCLGREGVPFRPYRALNEVLRYMQEHHGRRLRH
jgi:2-hydroxy-3-keto-5-methylthiopentenyl-1-phosphate phosphatase